MRPTIVVILIVASIATPVATSALVLRLAPSCGPQLVAHLGLACARPDGLLDVYSSTGRLLFTTHGFDVVPSYPSPALPGATPVPPTCVSEGADDRYGVVIYAVPSDQPDRYNETLPSLRHAVNLTNGDLRAASDPAGVPIDLKMVCDARGLVVVRQARLLANTSESNAGQLVHELFTRGFLDAHAKNWILFDDATNSTPYSGLGSYCFDDRVVLDNCSNGGGMVAISFRGPHDFIFLHEIGHNMGAVPANSPNTSGAGHCNDGWDVMCYDDGGPFANYSSDACATYAWDCGSNDYFAPDPAAGSYAATHWNLASPLNRFLRVGNATHPPTMRELACSTANESLICSFAATSPTLNVTYNVTWPNGTSERVPLTGSMPAGARVTLIRDAPSDPEDFVVSVTASSTHGATSAPRMYDAANLTPNQAPVVASVECPARVRAWAMVICRVVASDDGPSAKFLFQWESSSVATRWRNPLGPIDVFYSFAAGNETFRNVTVTITATDDGSPPLSSEPTFVTVEVESPPGPECSATFAGNLLVAVPLIDQQDVDAASIDLPLECRGARFDLAGFGDDFDVCFDFASGIECARSDGDESGTVPPTAWRATVVLAEGALASYELRLHP